MSKKNMIMRVAVIIVMIVAFVAAPVFADISTDFPDGSIVGITKVDTSVKKVWSTVMTIVQILAFAAVVFAGLRYMFASADQKADIKKGLGMLTIGAILVFAASTVVKFVVDAADQII